MKARIPAALLGMLFAMAAQGQWERAPHPSIPRTANGEPNLDARPPRTEDGKLDLSGVWTPDTDPLPEGIETVEGELPFPRHMINFAADIPPEELGMTPWASALFDQRLANEGKDSPTALCRPTGMPNLTAVMLPYKIIQTPDVVVVLYEENTVFRQIFLDGRKPVDDPLPRYMGYSTGRWDGDDLVVETTGISENTWLDGMGHPHTAALRLTERFRRPTAGHLEIETTVDDPGAYAKPITYTLRLTALADDDLLEYFCSDNEKSSEHYQ
jgi:hypothetical protein